MNKISAKRLHWVDVVKGVLMLMVIWGHCDNQAISAGIDDPVVANLCWIEHTWAPYFMCAFFVITGYCSNFNKTFNLFIISKIKSLIIPAVSIGILLNLAFDGGGIFDVIRIIPHTLLFGPVWFLAALFIACIIYYFINKYLTNCWQRYITLVLLVIMGLSLNLYVPSSIKIWYLPHALILTPFLEIGSYFKVHNNIFKKSIVLISVFVYTATLLLIFLISDFDKIGIYRKITITWFTLLPCYACSVTGSVLIINVGKLIDNSQILEYIGKNSILFYLLNYTLLGLYFDIYHSLFGINVIQSTVGFLTVYVATIITIAIVSKIMNIKYISYLIGKF